MKTRILFLTLLFFVTSFPVNAKIIADISSTHIEGNTFRARGKNLTSKNNPAQAWVQNLDGTNKTNIPITVNKKETAVKVTIPFVEEDTKMNLFISGGNVPENAAAQYLIVIINNPSITTTSSDLPTVTGSPGSGLGGVPGPQGPQGPSGDRGQPGFFYDGQRDINTLPDYDVMSDLREIKTLVRMGGISQEAGEINIGVANAVTVLDSNTETVNVVGLLKGTGATGQKVSLIVDNFFFLALSNNGFVKRDRSPPVVGSIVAPDFFTGPSPWRPTRTIEVSEYQLVPIYPGMVLELIFDGFQWRLINIPFYFDTCFDCVM